MRLATTEALASWLLVSFVGLLLGNPQQPHWVPYQQGIADNYPSEDRFSRQIHYQYQGYPESQYESIDDFQKQQTRQYEDEQLSSQSSYNYEDDYLNQLKNAQELYYKSLLQATKNPLIDQENQESLIKKHERNAYYQDYLPLDDSQNVQTQTDKNPTQGTYPNSDQPNELVSEYDSRKNLNDSRILKKVEVLARTLAEASHVPTLDDVEALNSLEDEMMAEASVPEEAKRVARQVRNQNPGFFWTLARLAYETANDTKSAANQIGQIINNNFAPDTTTQRLTASSSMVEIVTLPDDTTAGMKENINATTTSTTEAPFRLTRTEFQGIVRRNLRGLIRLFNIEWRDALNQSEITAREFQRDLGNQIRPYLEDNPNIKLK